MTRTRPPVRLSVALPRHIAKRVRVIAKMRRTITNRILMDLIQIGLRARRSESEHFLALAKCFKESSAAESCRLREELARLIFDKSRRISHRAVTRRALVMVERSPCGQLSTNPID